MNNGKMGEAKYINVGHRSPVKIDQCKLNILKIKNRPEIKKMVAQLVLTRWVSLANLCIQKYFYLRSWVLCLFLFASGSLLGIAYMIKHHFRISHKSSQERHLYSGRDPFERSLHPVPYCLFRERGTCISQLSQRYKNNATNKHHAKIKVK